MNIYIYIYIYLERESDTGDADLPAICWHNTVDNFC